MKIITPTEAATRRKILMDQNLSYRVMQAGTGMRERHDIFTGEAKHQEGRFFVMRS